MQSSHLTWSGAETTRRLLGGSAFRSSRLLIEADDVPSRVAKPCCDFGCVRADRLHDLTPIGHNHVEGCGHTIDHDVDQKARRRSRRAPADPGAAYLASRVVKGGVTITALPDVPAED